MSTILFLLGSLLKVLVKVLMFLIPPVLIFWILLWSANKGERAQKSGKILAWGATILGCVLIAGGYLANFLNPLILGDHGDRTDGIFRILSPLTLLLNRVLLIAQSLGSPFFLFIGVAGLIFLYGRSARFGVIRSRPFTFAALTIVVLIHAGIFASSVQFFFVPAGAEIRPMGWGLVVGILSLVSLAVVEPVSIMATIKEKPRFLGIIGMIGGITPFLLSSFILHLAARIKGFELEP